MSAFDDIIAAGIAQVHSRRCPACMMTDTETMLVDVPPLDRFHYHGADVLDPPRLWCPVDGQGYRIEQDQMLITVPCNGGMHSWEVLNESRRFA